MFSLASDVSQLHAFHDRSYPPSRFIDFSQRVVALLGEASVVRLAVVGNSTGQNDVICTGNFVRVGQVKDARTRYTRVRHGETLLAQR